MKRSDLNVVTFWPVVVYEPETHLQSLFASTDDLSLSMKHSIESASFLKRCELAELAAGNIQQHWFFVRRTLDSGVSSAIPSDLDAIPVLVNCGTSQGHYLAETIRQATSRMHWRYQNMNYDFQMDDVMLSILSRVDGERTVRSILLDTATDLGIQDITRLATSWALLFHHMVGVHKMALSVQGKNGVC